MGGESVGFPTFAVTASGQQQFQLVKNLFTTTVQEYRDNGPGALGAHDFREAATVLGQAFDVAIATENLKNEDKR